MPVPSIVLALEQTVPGLLTFKSLGNRDLMHLASVLIELSGHCYLKVSL